MVLVCFDLASKEGGSTRGWIRNEWRAYTAWYRYIRFLVLRYMYRYSMPVLVPVSSTDMLLVLKESVLGTAVFTGTKGVQYSAVASFRAGLLDSFSCRRVRSSIYRTMSSEKYSICVINV